MSQHVKYRLDQRVVELTPAINRSYAQHLISSGMVRVNGKIITKSGHKITNNDMIVIKQDFKNQKIPKIDIPVIYEDDNCVVINKPVGLLAHSKGAMNKEATVATWLKDRIDVLDFDEPKAKDLNDRYGIVHRLDRGTSGVMICAKNKQTLAYLQRQFTNRKALKTYIAIVRGIPPQNHAIIEMPIERNPKKPQTFRVGSNGKASITEFKLQKSNNKFSSLVLTPKTGRTHQLRVHLSHIGVPIVGDTLYGGPESDRLYLHSSSLTINIPGNITKTFEAKIPESFDNIIK
ncbi:MAG: RluA family pseudouridine synthase [bacterium]